MSFTKSGSCGDCGQPCSPRAKRCAECDRLSRIGTNVGPDNPFWKGGRNIGATGYVRIKRQGHPEADKSGNVHEHRIVAEEMLGRRLLKGEHVHHRNGDRTDNRPENLEVMDAGAHRRLHARANGSLSDDEIADLVRSGIPTTRIPASNRRVTYVRRVLLGLKPHEHWKQS